MDELKHIKSYIARRLSSLEDKDTSKLDEVFYMTFATETELNKILEFINYLENLK
ncbi:hypothetical protein [Sporosarcina sp. FSL W7-1283]|uniref:hypothetical protein n=1 Tax=Sporosarcina sp. FSL W7-1283 TaxID=2921560 RepID=UPI0030F6E732